MRQKECLLTALSTGYIVGICICAVLTSVVIAAYTETALFLFQHYGNWRPKDKALLLLGLYPVKHCKFYLISYLIAMFF